MGSSPTRQLVEICPGPLSLSGSTPIDLLLAGLQPLAGGCDRPQTILPTGQLGRQLGASAIRAVALVLLGVRLLGLRQQGLDLLAKTLLFFIHPGVAHRLVLARVGPHLRSIDGHRPELHEPQLPGRLHDLDEDVSKLRQVALPEIRNRPVGREVVGSEHAVRQVLVQLRRDLPRRKRARGVARL